MKTRILAIGTILCLGIVFQGCEKESDDSEISPQSNPDLLSTTNTTKVKHKQSKVSTDAYWSEDEDAGICACLPPSVDCDANGGGATGMLPTSNTFFDGAGDYIPSSFDNNYTIATNNFDANLVDDVINGDLIARRHINASGNSNIYIIFEKDGGTNITHAYEYD